MKKWMTFSAGLCALMLVGGCAVVSARTGKNGTSYGGWAFGEKASSTLAGLNLTDTTTREDAVVVDRGVGVEQSGSDSETKVADILSLAIIRALGAPQQPQQHAAPEDSEE